MSLLVFGKTGQVATELQARADLRAVGREQADLTKPEACAALILAERPTAVINAAAYTAVDRAEGEEVLAAAIFKLPRPDWHAGLKACLTDLGVST